MLKITAEVYGEMIRQCRQEYPNEACGYLAGEGNVATRAYSVVNEHQSPTSYVMNSAGQAVAQRDMREKRLSNLAIYHSHVATEAYPSRRDIENALAVQDFFEGYYVLVSLKTEPPKTRVFEIRVGFPKEVPWEEVQS